jgi:transposase-like protein
MNTLEGTTLDDPFSKIREIARHRDKAEEEWRTEVLCLRAAGYSLRAIAEVAGVSHDTVWRVQ